MTAEAVTDTPDRTVDDYLSSLRQGDRSAALTLVRGRAELVLTNRGAPSSVGPALRTALRSALREMPQAAATLD